MENLDFILQPQPTMSERTNVIEYKDKTAAINFVPINAYLYIIYG